MKTNMGQVVVSRAIRKTSGSYARCLRVDRLAAGLAVAIAGAALLGGCAATMPAPVGLTAAPQVAVDYNTASPFSVGVVPNRAPPVRIGEELGFTLSASASGYGHLYLLNASGAVLVLAENMPVTGGAQAVFPAPGGGFIFRASPPAGVERILFLVTRQPFAGFGGGASGPVQLPVKASEFVENLNAATGNFPGQRWGVQPFALVRSGLRHAEFRSCGSPNRRRTQFVSS